MTPRGLTLCTAINLVLLLVTLATRSRVEAEGVAPVLRGRALEIVDEHGRTRATLTVLPGGRTPTGDRDPETVLLRLITERGRPSVKISASEDGAGLTVTGPTGTRRTYATLEASGTGTALTLKGEDGRAQVVASDRQ